MPQNAAQNAPLQTIMALSVNESKAPPGSRCMRNQDQAVQLWNLYGFSAQFALWVMTTGDLLELSLLVVGCWLCGVVVAVAVVVEVVGGWWLVVGWLVGGWWFVVVEVDMEVAVAGGGGGGRGGGSGSGFLWLSWLLCLLLTMVNETRVRPQHVTTC